MTAPTYTGQAANITPPSFVNIASSTNASPIVITTSGPHGIADGSNVDVINHQVNTAANGVWQIGYISSTTFQLVGSTGNGVGGATGNVRGLYPGAVQLIDGTVGPTAGAFNTPYEFNCDSEAYLFQASGAYKFVQRTELSNTDDTGGTWDQFNLVSNNVYAPNASGNSIGVLGVGSNPYLNQGDILIVEFDVNVEWAAGNNVGSSIAKLALFASMYAPGVTPPTAVRVPGSMRQMGQPNATAGLLFITPARLSATIVIGSTTGFTNPLSGLSMKLYVQAQSPSVVAIASQINMVGDYSARMTQYRPTGVSQ
jgi:hypothetical protein